MERQYKLLILGFAFIIFIMPTVLAGSCNSNSYEFCWEEKGVQTYDDSTARSTARLEVSKDDRENLYQDGHFHFLNYYQIPYRCTGDNAYIVDSRTYTGDLDDAWNGCSDGGCPYTKIDKQGSIKLSGEIEDFSIMCYDYDYDSSADGSWAWVWSTSQWNFKNQKVRTVKCIQDGDCGAEPYFCNQEGTWDQWKCDIDRCAGIVCDSKCFDDSTILKEGYCEPETGSCKYNLKKSCDDNNPLTLVDSCEEREISVNDDLVSIAFSITGTNVQDTKLQAYCSSSDPVECLTDNDCDDNNKFTIQDWCNGEICVHSQEVECLNSGDCNAEETCESNKCKEKSIVDDIIDSVTDPEDVEVTTEPSELKQFKSFIPYFLIGSGIIIVLTTILIIYIIRKIK